MPAPLSSLAVELTGQCNQKCTYCYNGYRADDGESLDAGGAEETLARIDELLSELPLERMVLTGGEPLSKRVVWPVLDRLAARGIRVGIISNGGLISDAVAARLATYPIDFIQVTLNGDTEELHARHVGPGHHRQTTRGIDALLRHGVRVVGCTVVTRLNAAAVGAIAEQWVHRGVEELSLSRFSPAGYAVEHVAELLPSLPDLELAFAQAAAVARREGLRVRSTMPIPRCMLDPADYAPITFGSCGIGSAGQEYALGADGRLRHCTLHADPLGDDVLHTSVHAIVASDEAKRYREALPAFCEGCVHAETCGGGCGAAAQWLLGMDHERRVPRRHVDPLLWQHVDDAFAQRLSDARSHRRKLEVLQ